MKRTCRLELLKLLQNKNVEYRKDIEWAKDIEKKIDQNHRWKGIDYRFEWEPAEIKSFASYGFDNAKYAQDVNFHKKKLEEFLGRRISNEIIERRLKENDENSFKGNGAAAVSLLTFNEVLDLNNATLRAIGLVLPINKFNIDKNDRNIRTKARTIWSKLNIFFKKIIILYGYHVDEIKSRINTMHEKKLINYRKTVIHAFDTGVKQIKPVVEARVKGDGQTIREKHGFTAEDEVGLKREWDQKSFEEKVAILLDFGYPFFEDFNPNNPPDKTLAYFVFLERMTKYATLRAGEIAKEQFYFSEDVIPVEEDWYKTSEEMTDKQIKKEWKQDRKSIYDYSLIDGLWEE